MKASLWLSSPPNNTQRTAGSVCPGRRNFDRRSRLCHWILGRLRSNDACKRRIGTLEELQGLVKTTTTSGSGAAVLDLASYPTPLLMTVVEQLNTKVGNKLLGFLGG